LASLRSSKGCFGQSLLRPWAAMPFFQATGRSIPIKAGLLAAVAAALQPAAARAEPEFLVTAFADTYYAHDFNDLATRKRP
jgi:hypothetical protein